MKTLIQYECEFCNTKYPTSEEALKCEALANAMPKAACKVGDIVLCRAGFGWYDGDREWISNAKKVDPKEQGKPGPMTRRACPHGDSNCFADCCTFQFYYVVTHIDRDSQSYRRHALRYHLVTNAMTEKTGYHSGYTYDQGHFPPRRARKVPLSVKSAAKKLIGQRASNLL